VGNIEQDSPRLLIVVTVDLESLVGKRDETLEVIAYGNAIRIPVFLVPGLFHGVRWRKSDRRALDFAGITEHLFIEVSGTFATEIDNIGLDFRNKLNSVQSIVIGVFLSFEDDLRQLDEVLFGHFIALSTYHR
jgi:hypothetical protein